MSPRRWGTRGGAFRVETGDALPVRAPQYRRPKRQAEVIERHVQEMLELGVISRAASP